MPKLQIDGKDIADLSDGAATTLDVLAANGVGSDQEPEQPSSIFGLAVSTPPKHAEYVLRLFFPAAADGVDDSTDKN